jgi:hypothetical protein
MSEGRRKSSAEEDDPIIEVVNRDAVKGILVSYLSQTDYRPPTEDDGPPTRPRIEAGGLALGMSLQESVDKIGTVLTSLEGIQSTWGRVELMTEIRKMRSLLEALEGLIKTHPAE